MERSLPRLVQTALGCAVLLLSQPAAAEPLPLTWLISDQSPQFILSGPDQKMGSIDGAMAYLQDRLPEYDHRVEVNNIQRTQAELQTDGPFVAMGLVKTPDREKLFLFSEAFTVALPPGLLVQRSRLAALKPYLGSNGLDLNAFLGSGKFLVGVAAGRSYGPVTDALLLEYRDKGVVETRFADKGIMAGLVQMLTLGRVDAVFAYRSEMRYVIRDEAQLKSLIVLPIVPAGNLLTIHAAVPRTPWGRAFLDRLNPLLVKARVDAGFRAVTDRWSDDESRALTLKVIQALN